MTTRIEHLVVKISADGAGPARAEIVGVADATRKVGDEADRGAPKLTNMTSMLRGLALGGGAALGMREIAQAIGAVVKAATEAEQADARLQATMRATGRDITGATESMRRYADALEKATGIDGEEIKNAIAVLTTFDEVHGETFERAVRVAADLSQLYGTDLQSAMKDVGRALQNPYEGIQLIERMIGKLQPQQRDMLEQFKRTNDLAGAQALILQTLEGRLGGVAQEMNTGLTRATRTLNNEWDNFVANIGRTEVVSGGISGVLRPLNALLEATNAALELQRQARLELATGQLSPLVPGPGLDITGINQSGRAQFGAPPKLGTGGAAGAPPVDETRNVRAEIDRLTASLRQQADTFGQGQLAVIGYRIAFGDLQAATAEQKAALLSNAGAIDAQREAQKEAAKVQDEHNKLMAEGAQLTENLRTPGEQFAAALERLDTLLVKGAISWETYQRAIDDAMTTTQQAQQNLEEDAHDRAPKWADAWTSAGNRFAAGIGDSVADAVLYQQNFSDAMRAIAQGVVRQLISSLVEIGVKKLALAALETSALAGQTAASVAAAGTVASAWAAAAAETSLASFGANAIPAAAALTETHALSHTLALAGQAHDGLDYVPRTGTYVLEEGEAVVKKDQNKALQEFLARGGGAQVTVNYNISAADGASVERMLRKRAGTIGGIAVRAVQQAYRNSYRAGPLG